MKCFDNRLGHGTFNRLTVCMALFAAVVAAERPVQAAPLLFAEAKARLTTNHSFWDEYSETSTSHAKALSLVTNSDGSAGGNSADGQADARFGHNSALALVSSTYTDYAFAAAASRWKDTFTITDPNQPSNAILTVTMGMQLEGLLLAPHPNSFALVEFAFNATHNAAHFSAEIDQGFNQPVSSPTFIDVDEFLSVNVPFFNGTPFDVFAYLDVYAYVTGNHSDLPFIVKSDFSSTATLTVLDLPPGAIFSAESGQTYPIPEPASLGLMLLLIGGGVASRRARRPATTSANGTLNR